MDFDGSFTAVLCFWWCSRSWSCLCQMKHFISWDTENRKCNLGPSYCLICISFRGFFFFLLMNENCFVPFCRARHPAEWGWAEALLCDGSSLNRSPLCNTIRKCCVSELFSAQLPPYTSLTIHALFGQKHAASHLSGNECEANLQQLKINELGVFSNWIFFNTEKNNSIIPTGCA